MNFYFASIAVVLLIFTHSVAYVIGNGHGATSERAAWIKSEGARTQALADTLGGIKSESEAKIAALQEEVKTLRSSPSQTRVIVEKAKQCDAMPQDWRRSWNN